MIMDLIGIGLAFGLSVGLPIYFICLGVATIIKSFDEEIKNDDIY